MYNPYLKLPGRTPDGHLDLTGECLFERTESGNLRFRFYANPDDVHIIMEFNRDKTVQARMVGMFVGTAIGFLLGVLATAALLYWD